MMLLTGGAPDNLDRRPLEVRYWAVEASVEGLEAPYFDVGAKPIRTLLEDLRFDRFITRCEAAASLQADKDEKAVLTNRYTMGLRYTGQDASGRARVVVTVMLAQEKPESPPQKAVETALLLAPGGTARVCGLRSENKAEIIIVLARSQTAARDPESGNTR